MANTITSPNMVLPIPVTGVDTGPDWANNLNNCLLRIDSHNHSDNSGVQITPNGLDISSDLSFKINNAIDMRSVRFQTQPAALALPTDLGCLYESGVDLYFNDGNGNQIQITQSGGIAGSPGSISNLVSPASAAYLSVNSTFVWQSASNTPANLDAGFIILRNNSVSSFGLTLSPPTAMGSNRTITLPDTVVAQSFLTIDTSGNMTGYAPIAGGITGSNIASATITGSNIASATITGTNVAANINLDGKTVQEQGLNVIVSNTNATNSLCMVRGVVRFDGVILSGEGFSISKLGTGSYRVTFTTPFGDTPAVTVTAGAIANYYLIQTGGLLPNTFLVSTLNAALAAGDNSFNFIAVGQRA